MLRKAAKALALLPAFPLVLLARLLRPFVLIRFGRLREDRIGHLAANTEVYLCRRAAKPASLDFFCFSRETANAQLTLMFSRILRMHWWVWPLWKLNSILPGGAAHEIELPFTEPANDYEGARDLLARVPAHISFTEEERRRGYRALRDMGIPEGMPFVCFHSRDQAYLNKTQPGKNWDYHAFRNSNIENYLAAAEALTRRGYAALRMGSVVASPLETKNPLIVDYASRWRTEFLDLFLVGHCAFFISGNSGISDVAELFRKPQVRTNMTQLWGELPFAAPGDVILPKLVWLEKEGRRMTWPEYVAGPAWEVGRATDLSSAGIRMLENSPEEIEEAALELEGRLKGSWKETGEDARRQEAFWRIFVDAGKIRRPVARVSAGFLRRYPELLEDGAAARPKSS